MIVYRTTKAGFAEDVLNDVITERIIENVKEKLHHRTSLQEIRSWQNSLQYMNTVIHDPEIPADCGVAIEYQLPQSGKRVDFIITGLKEDGTKAAILVELKQWSTATLSTKDGVVNTFIGKGIQELTHPSYQAWSYACFLDNFSEAVEDENIQLKPCAYLHNYVDDDTIRNSHYKHYLDKAPVFLKGEATKLRDFIKFYVKKGDQSKILFSIDKGKIRPSKMLADSMVKMLKGNQEFVMIDEQKLVFETAKQLAAKASNAKQVLIVSGGPGTGKSVVAINILTELTMQGFLTQYVSKNAAPRSVYQAKLTGSFRKGFIDNLFKGSGGFIDSEKNLFHALIVDEAHRLNEKSGLYGNLGENQVKEIINAAKTSVFFVDEDQRVTLDDIGSKEEIRKWSLRHNAEITEMELASQFRCKGSDGYLSWLDHTLQIRETANVTLDDIDYDFQIFDSPVDLRRAIEEKNRINNKSRMVAGYCWKWASKKDPKAYDVIIPEYDFKMRWNLSQDGSLWIIAPESINEIGCIHTCQGLEVDYVGVIIGPDMVYQEGKILTQPAARASSDRSVFGWKAKMKEDPQTMKVKLRSIIKNTYRTLLTRGMKGCYVYCTDKKLSTYLKEIQ